MKGASRGFIDRCRQRLLRIATGFSHAFGVRLWGRPLALTHATGTGVDVVRSRAQLLAEHAFLRQQLLVLRRSVKRPAVTPLDRALLVLFAGRVHAWRQSLLLVRPETLLRWHRAGFRAYWRRKSRPGPGRPPLAAETVALIRQMAEENPLWGAERIRGELLKRGIRVAKRTIHTYLRSATAPRPRGQKWATFLRAHAAEAWACDFLPVKDALFRPLFACFVIEPATRRVIHVGATRHPTDAWVAQQLREATPYGQRPRYLIRDNDGKFGATFARVAETSGIAILRTPHRAPQANALCERFLGSVRRECTDHLLIFGERHLRRALREYVTYFNRGRPHQGLGQALPEPSPGELAHRAAGPIRAVPVLGGLHHTYQRAA